MAGRDRWGDERLDGWRGEVYRVVFESDSRAGRLFDIILIALILASIGVVIADSVPSLQERFALGFDVLEWGFTLIFTVEYAARLLCVRRPLRYAASFFGIVDLLSVLPTYLALFFPELHALIDVRILRLLRIFRIFKLTAYITEYQAMADALRASVRKILVFLSVVLMIVVVMGTVMYVVEGPENGYTSIPTGIYWAITTMTTVGFGDITPKTELGRFIASAMMLLGWGTLAVPTGIVTTEMALRRGRESSLTEAPLTHALQAEGELAAARRCSACGSTDHSSAAAYCQHCGARLP